MQSKTKGAVPYPTRKQLTFTFYGWITVMAISAYSLSVNDIQNRGFLVLGILTTLSTLVFFITPMLYFNKPKRKQRRLQAKVI